MKETSGKIISEEDGVLNSLSPLIKAGSSSMKITLASATDVAIQKKIYGSGLTTLQNHGNV